MPPREYEVREAHAGMRADKFLVQNEPELSRDRAKELFRRGAVRVRSVSKVRGLAISKSYVLQLGDRVILLEAPRPRDFLPHPDSSVPFETLFVDEDVVVACKAPGVPCHPLDPSERGTLVQGLLASFPSMAAAGYAQRESGLLHRIDTFTSGIVLAAQNQEAFLFLKEELRHGKMEKHYLAVCVGLIPTQTIDMPIAADPKNSKRVISGEQAFHRKDAKPAQTVVLQSQPLPNHENLAHLSLVTLRVDSGRRHQIRVHLSTLGHPLLGDVLYGGPLLKDIRSEEACKGKLPQQVLQGHFLHASNIRFKHPKQNRIIEAAAPLPKEREELLKVLSS